jgi:hypothetical protein
LKGHHLSALSRLLRPYSFITITGILAFAPVSFMLRALKNDIISIEYPINYFISQCIHNGEMPYWFNTWGMGFPLESNLTWGIYSTPQMLFSSIFNYNIYVLHIEFIFYILLAGWSMYYLLQKYFLKDEKIGQLLACCYMLSGFIIGSSQWLLYITAASFLPILLSCLMQLLQVPSKKNVLLLAIIYFMMFTSVYPAFIIITTYSLVLITVCWFLISKDTSRKKLLTLFYLSISGILAILFCLPCLYNTFELLKHMERGIPIAGNLHFFNTNYLPPSALSNFFFPFSSVKMSFPNTEGTMFHSYMGLFILLLLPATILQSFRQTNLKSFLVLAGSLFFLVASFGAILPFRNFLNVLPGFSYFRHAGIFRFFFIFAMILYVGMMLKSKSWEEIFDFKKNNYSKTIKITMLIIAFISLCVLLINIQSAKGLSFSSVNDFFKKINLSQTLIISAAIQLTLIIFLYFTATTKSYRFTKVIFAVDLIINTLLCTPYFVVSSNSIRQVNAILHSVKGFPIQSGKVNQSDATYIDKKLNTWSNVNIFHKKVSGNESYRGPLTLENFSRYTDDSAIAKQIFNHAIIFKGNDSISVNDELKLIIQRPAHIRAQVNAEEPTTITVMQNYFPGWKAYYNNKYVDFINQDKPGLTINIPKGKGRIDFIYSKKGVWISALLLHLTAIGFFLFYIYRNLKKKIRFSSIP